MKRRQGRILSSCLSGNGGNEVPEDGRLPGHLWTLSSIGDAHSEMHSQSRWRHWQGLCSPLETFFWH